MKRLFYLLIALALVLGWRDWNRREIVYPPGVLVAEPPRQSVSQHAEPFEFRGYRLTPRAVFELRARVLSRADYHWGDEAELSPTDLALGWGAMSDQAVLDRIEVSQGSRWYFTRYERPGPLTDGEIMRSSGNMHILPANAGVRSELRQLRRGDILRARGLLVDVEGDSGFRWRTSLSREDSGDGACELFYVEWLATERAY